MGQERTPRTANPLALLPLSYHNSRGKERGFIMKNIVEIIREELEARRIAVPGIRA